MISLLCDAVSVLAIIAYALAAWSGYLTLLLLRSRSDMRLRAVVPIVSAYLARLAHLRPFNRPHDGLGWAVVYVAVNLSTMACAIFLVRNSDLVLSHTAPPRELSALPGAAAHLLASLSTLMFHTAVHATAKNTPELLDE